MNLGLTLKQQKFCDEYLLSGNASEAAIKAGYKPKTARQMGAENLSKPYIKEYLEEKMQEMESAKIASAVEILQSLTSIARDPEESTSDRIKCLELLGKRHALFTEKLSVSGSVPVVITGGDLLED